MEQPPPVAGAPQGRLFHGRVAARDFWFLARRDDAVWQAPHKEEQRSLQPGSARGYPSHENKLQPGSARGHPSHEYHQGPKSAPRPAPSASPVVRPRSSTMEQASPVVGAPRTRLFHGSAADTRRFRLDGALGLGSLPRLLVRPMLVWRGRTGPRNWPVCRFDPRNSTSLPREAGAPYRLRAARYALSAAHRRQEDTFRRCASRIGCLTQSGWSDIAWMGILQAPRSRRPAE